MKYEKKQTKNKITFSVIIKKQDFDKKYHQVFDILKQDLDLKGFRKGHVPTNIAKTHIDQSQVLNYTANALIEEKWLEIVKKEDLTAIDSPNVKILKLAQGNPFEFEVEVETLPDINLPDYKKIAKTITKNKVKVEEKEIQSALNWLAQSRAKFFQKNGKAEKGDLVEITYRLKDEQEKKDRFILGKGHYLKGLEENLIGLKKGDKKEIKLKEFVVNVSIDSVQKMEVKALDDNFAKEVGFDSLLKLKENVEKGLKQEKETAEKQRIRTEVLEKIAKEATFEIPEVLIQRETESLFGNLKNRVTYELQTTFDEYLKQVKKDEAQVKKEFEKVAKKRVKAFLILNKIEKLENISIKQEEIDQKIEEIIKDQPDKAKAREDIEKGDAIYYIEDELKKEKIFSLLGH